LHVYVAFAGASVAVRDNLAPPSGDNIKGFPLSLSDSKMATRCRPLGPIQIYLQTATDRTAGGSVPRLYTLHKEALLLAG